MQQFDVVTIFNVHYKFGIYTTNMEIGTVFVIELGSYEQISLENACMLNHFEACKKSKTSKFSKASLGKTQSKLDATSLHATSMI